MAIAASTAKKFSIGKKWRIFSIKSIIKHKTSIDWIHLPWRTNRFWFFNSLDFLFPPVYVDLITKTSCYLWHFHYYPNINMMFYITVSTMHLSIGIAFDSEWICFTPLCIVVYFIRNSPGALLILPSFFAYRTIKPHSIFDIAALSIVE